MSRQDADRQADSRQCYVISIYQCLLADISELSGVPLGAPNDITYEWVLKEAPKLDKELLSFLEGSGTLPVFPEWLTPLVDVFLSSNDGKYLKYIRQVLLFCYKIELEPTNEQIREAQASFENVEGSVVGWEEHHSRCSSWLAPLLSYAQKVVGRVIHRINWSSILPSHGPGAVYPPCKPCNKSQFRTIYTTIEPHYSYCDYFCAIPSFWDDIVVKGDASIAIHDTIECHMVAVPKDSRGPRLICVHPKEAVWIQQGCRRLLERAITSPSSPCHGRIVFDDQGVNGGLALKASIDREYCTLDLKEASDRISCSLVRLLFGDYAYEKLSCSRAHRVRLLDERIIDLRKWAPMGNALTFPVQSLIFFSLVQAGIMCRYGTYCSDIYVFGDDILFPVKFYDGVVDALLRVGLAVNFNKTFLHGFFRESCGVDAYRGIDVTPRRLRELDASSGPGALSMCTLAKALYIDGMHRTSSALYREVQRYHGRLPLGNNPLTQGLYRYEACDLVTLLHHEGSLRFNQRHHKWQTRVTLVGGLLSQPATDAWWHLQDSLLSLTHRGSSEVATRGLEYAVPHRTRLQRGWADVV